MAEKIVYKNHCTPQEQADFSTATDRWYLDSDVGRKLSGVCESKATTTGSLVTHTFQSQAIDSFANGTDGDNSDVEVTLTNHGFLSGDSIVISGTSNYNGTYTIDQVTANDFDIEDTFVSDETSGSATKLATLSSRNLTSTKFIYVKNTDTSGSDYLLVNIGGMGAVIKLGPEESFASDIGSTDSDSTTVAITASGTPTYEYIAGT